MSTPAQPPEEVRLKKRSVLLMILFSIITFGFYMPFWFVSGRKALNQLNPRYQVSLSLCILLFAANAVSFLVSEAVVITTELAFAIIYLILAFRVKNILNSTLFKQRKEPVPSLAHQEEVLVVTQTLFLGIFYLQYKINRLPAGQELEQESP